MTSLLAGSNSATTVVKHCTYLALSTAETLNAQEEAAAARSELAAVKQQLAEVTATLSTQDTT